MNMIHFLNLTKTSEKQVLLASYVLEEEEFDEDAEEREDEDGDSVKTKNMCSVF